MRTPSEIAQELGYPVHYRASDYIATTPIYRGGDSHGLMIYADHFWDAPANRRGTIVELAQLTMGWNKVEATKWHGEEQKSDIVSEVEEKEDNPDVFNPSEIGMLIPNYKFYAERGISEEIQKEFSGGLCMGGRLYGRFSFPIYHSSGELRGYAGRKTLENLGGEKWKIIGKKRHFDYPYFLNQGYIKEAGFVILVESVGDMLALWAAGVKNVLVCFGISLQKELFSLLIQIGVKVVLALNNDESNRGQIGMEKMKKKLLTMLSAERVSICLPTKNDFGIMTREEIIEWREKIKMQNLSIKMEKSLDFSSTSTKFLSRIHSGVSF